MEARTFDNDWHGTEVMWLCILDFDDIALHRLAVIRRTIMYLHSPEQFLSRGT
jgi:hypothetical protein